MGGVIAGGGGITKTQNGMLSLGGANLFFDATNVNGGILEGNTATSLGSLVSSVTVADGATLDLTGAFVGKL